MNSFTDSFYRLYSSLFLCCDNDNAKQLDIYNQLESLYNYFNNCVWSDSKLEKGQTYILPLDLKIGLFYEEDYTEFTNPANGDEYDPDLAPFVESHNKSIEDEMIWITLKAGTQFIYDGYKNYAGHIMLVDGYPVECYGGIIDSDSDDVPFVIKA